MDGQNDFVRSLTIQLGKKYRHVTSSFTVCASLKEKACNIWIGFQFFVSNRSSYFA